MRAIALLAVFLAGCGGDLTASEATDAANDQLAEELPQVRSLHLLRIETQDMNEKWRVIYSAEGGIGRVVIEVNKQSGEAAIVSMEQ